MRLLAGVSTVMQYLRRCLMVNSKSQD